MSRIYDGIDLKQPDTPDERLAVLVAMKCKINKGWEFVGMCHCHLPNGKRLIHIYTYNPALKRDGMTAVQVH